MRRSLQPTHILRISMLHRANQISTRERRIRRLARAINVANHHMVRIPKAGCKVRHQSPGAAVGVRLKHGPQRAARKSLPRTRQCCADLRWMMRVIIHNSYSMHFALHLKTPPHPPKRAQRRQRSCKRHATIINGCQRRQRVAYVVVSGQPRARQAQFAPGMAHQKIAAASAVGLQQLCAPVRASLQSIGHHARAALARTLRQRPRTRIIIANYQHTLRRHKRRKLVKCCLHLGKCRIAIRMVMLNICDHRHCRPQTQKHAVVFVCFNNKRQACAMARICIQVANQTADNE